MKLKLTRWFLPSLLVVFLALALVAPVLAAYYIDISVTESDGTDYGMLAINVGMDIGYLADHQFILADGTDVRVKDSQGGNLPFMLAEDRVVFASDITASKTSNFQLTTGNTPLANFDVCVGHGGNVTIPDHANIEIGNNFELVWDGHITTDVEDVLILKTRGFKTYFDGAGNIKVEICATNSTEQTANDSTTEIYSGRSRVGERINSFPISDITKLSFYLSKTGTITGTAYARVRKVSDDSIIGTLASIDVATLTGSLVWYDFVGSVANPSAQNLRFTFEYTGGDVNNYVNFAYQSTNVVAGIRTVYTASWADVSTEDAAFKLYYTTGAVDVSATAAVSSGKHKITVAANGTKLKIYEGDEERANVDLLGASVPDVTANWVLGGDAMPCFTYTHKVGANDRIEYAPDDIISGVAYSTGTVTVTNGDATVEGSGTTWTSSMAGSLFVSTDAVQYVVGSVTDSNTLELTTAYGGGTLGGQNYNLYVRLPNELGSYDGRVTWGDTPEGIDVSRSVLELEEDYYFYGPDGDTVDIFRPEPAQLISGVDLERLEHNPFYPLVAAITAASKGRLTTSLVWIGGAWFITIAAVVASFILLREHLILAGLVGMGLSILFYTMGIFDWWVLIVFAIGAIAAIVHERATQW